MKKLILLASVCFLYSFSIGQQNIGVGTTSPTSKLDVNGGIALREGTAITLANGGASGGTNDNITLPVISGTSDIASFYRITGPSTAFSVYGIIPATGADGQVVTLVNTTGKVMTVVNSSSSPTVTRGIITQTGTNLVDNASATANSSITLQYNKTAGRWYVTGTQNFIVAPASIATSNTLGSATNTMTSTVDGVAATSSIITGNTLTNPVNTITSTVNGVAATAPAVNTTALSLNTTNLTSTVNGVGSSALDLTPAINAGVTKGNLTTSSTGLTVGSGTGAVLGGGTTVNYNLVTGIGGLSSGAQGTLGGTGSANTYVGADGNTHVLPAAAATTVSNGSSTNTLTTTVNGVTGTGVNIINSNAETWTQAGGVTNTVNGVSANVTPASGTITNVVGYNSAGTPVYQVVAGVLGNTTHTLTNPVNTITSTVNGVAVTAPAVNTVSNNSSVNTLTTTVNGVAGTGVNIINSNALGLSGTSITSTVNGVASSSLDISPVVKEPWNVGGGSTGATSNTQTIYQAGNVGVNSRAAGDNSYNFAVSAPAASLVAVAPVTAVAAGTATTTAVRVAAPGTTSNKYPVSADLKIGSYATTGANAQSQLDIALGNGATGTPDVTVMSLLGNGNINIPGLTASSEVYTDASKNLTSTPPTTGVLGYWTRNSGSGYLFNTTQTDNVGIGTITPGVKFDVIGQGRFAASGGGSASAVILSAANPALAWSATGQGIDLKWWDMLISGTTLLGRAVNDGNSNAANWLQVNRGATFTIGSVTFPNGLVGIGVTGPAAPLDVQTAITATTASTYGTRLQQTLTAHANSDMLAALYVNPTFTNGAFTSVTNYGLVVTSGSSVFANNGGGSSNRVYLAGTGDLNHYIYSSGTGGNQMYLGEYNGVYNFVNTAGGNNIVFNNGAISGATGFISSGTIQLSSLTTNGLVKTTSANGTLAVATAGTDYQAPMSAGTGITISSNTINSYWTYSSPYLYSNTATNVGVGIAAPATRLHVYTTTDADGIEVDGTNSVAFRLANAGTLKAAISLPEATGSWSTDALANDLVIRTQATSQKILFNTNGGTGASTLAINSGNVGVGTNAPGTKLQVAGGGNQDLIVGNTGSSQQILIGNGSGYSTIQAVLQGTAYNALALNAIGGGNVGIGTTNPVNKLQVEGNLHMDGNAIYLRSGPSDQYDLIRWNSGTDKIDMGGYNGVTLGYTNPASNVVTATLTVNGSNVGIGIASPIGKLDVQGPTTRSGTAPTSPTFYVTGTLNDGTTGPASGNIEFRHDNQTQGIGFGYQTIYAAGSNSSQPINIIAKGGAAITLNAYSYGTGNVGVGTSTPNDKLEVNGNIRLTSGGSLYAPNQTGGGASGSSITVEAGNAIFSGACAYGGNVNIISGNMNSDGSNCAGSTNSPASGNVILRGGVNQFTNAVNGNIFFYAGESSAGQSQSDKLRMMIVGDNGFVGIGTTAPGAPLHVGQGSGTGITTATLTREYFNAGSGTGGFSPGSSGSGNIMVQADGYYWANGGGYVATSDSRIKNIIGVSDNGKDLETLSKIKITDYKYIDEVANGSKPQKKVIAQQVNEFYPTAVNKNEGIIPSVYETAKSVTASGNVTIIETTKPHDFKGGDEVKLVLEKSGGKTFHVSVIDAHTFSVAENISEKVFVYGKKVKDLLSIDYDALSTLNISATQELARKVAALEKQNEALKSANSKLDQQNSDLVKKVDALASGNSEIQLMKKQLDDLKELMQKNGIRSEKQ